MSRERSDVDNMKEIGKRVLDQFKAWGLAQGWKLEDENFEGWRFNTSESGWILLR